MTTKEKDLNLNNIQGLNNYIEKDIVGQVIEAVKHFSKRKRHTAYDFDERYFYDFRQLEMFEKTNTNSAVKVEIVYNERKVLDYIKVYRK